VRIGDNKIEQSDFHWFVISLGFLLADDKRWMGLLSLMGPGCAGWFVARGRLVACRRQS